MIFIVPLNYLNVSITYNIFILKRLMWENGFRPVCSCGSSMIDGFTRDRSQLGIELERSFTFLWKLKNISLHNMTRYVNEKSI